MLDFWQVSIRSNKKNPDEVNVYPKFIVNPRTKDLMIRGGDFYAVWDEDKGLWSTDEQTVIDIVDDELKNTASQLEGTGKNIKGVEFMYDADSGSIDRWHKFCQKQMRDVYKTLNQNVVFANSKIKKSDYASIRLPYALEEGSIDAYDELISVLYDPKERQKIEWAIGAIISGDSKRIQKFEVLYGSHGTGKSTVLRIIESLFAGYWNTFNAKELGAANTAFALESFKSNPIVSIQHDGDLSRIEDNTKLNSIISHESLEVNAKYTKIYVSEFKTFLFMGTNKPVKITEAKSGIIRRLIDVYPSGRKVSYSRYMQLKNQINFELGAIAYHCLNVYKKMGEDYYEAYVPTGMISATNDFYDFIVYKFDELASRDYITQTEAWGLYLEYCEFAHAHPMPYRSMGVEFRNYYEDFFDRKIMDGKRLRNVYVGFLKDKFSSTETDGSKEADTWLKFDQTHSLFDDEFSQSKAQYCKEDGSPKDPWAFVNTHLIDIDTSKLHWVKPPEEIVVIDFDKKNLSGEKDINENLKAASLWPKTYGELSKSGFAIHLVYRYEGDVSKLNYIYDEDVEIKRFTGNASLRRLLSKCNDIQIATLKEGSLPLKGEARVINWDGIKNERILRKMIVKNLHKEYHPDTSSSIDFIKKLLDDAYDAGFAYDVEDLRKAVYDFASNSSNQSDRCKKVVQQMKFKSKEELLDIRESSENSEEDDKDKDLVFFDIECYVNFFGVVYKKHYADACSYMVNPTPEEVQSFIKTYDGYLVGFNNRSYDNHLLYARAFKAYSNASLYDLSQSIINEGRGKIGAAYDISYTDVFDFCTEKKSLKKWEVALGIHHQEMGIPWDQPVPEDMIPKVMEYCENDVRATEAVFDARKGDFAARKIQVALVKMLHGDDIKVSVNDTTNTLSKRIIFGKNTTPQSSFNYRNLALPVGFNQYDEYRKKFGEDYVFRVFDEYGLPLYRDYIPGEVLPDGYSILPFFPGYKFGFSSRSEYYDEAVTNEVGFSKSIYLGEEVGEGGRVYSEIGYYEWVWDGDIASQHPHSIIAEVLFGPVYTKIFKEIVEARVAVKHRDYETAGNLLGGALKPFLKDELSGDLAQALKIVINSIYGLTKAGFINEFRDSRNEDNIVAKRGALFMTLLKREIQRRGYRVCHIKTDSIKIPNADDKIKDFVIKFGKEYGYDFETEGVFTKFCLFNDAAYVAKEEGGGWITKAAQFNKDTSPYVYKTLFSHDPIEFKDMCETKSVSKGALYLDFNEDLEDVSEYEKLLDKAIKKGGSEEEIANLKAVIESGHNYSFVGRVGNFCPVIDGCGGGILYRIENGRRYAATGTTGYRWLESEYVAKYGGLKLVNKEFYTKQVNAAIEAIRGLIEPSERSLDWFLSDEDPIKRLPVSDDFMNIPEGNFEEMPFESN